MAERPGALTKNYKLTIFPDNEAVANLTFKEFRDWLAGEGTDANTFSTIQQIDACLAELRGAIESAIEQSKTNINNEITDLRELIDDEDRDSVRVGREDEFKKPIEFHDDTDISILEGGKFTVGGIATDYINFGNYAIEHNSDNDHLEIFYKGGAQ